MKRKQFLCNYNLMHGLRTILKVDDSMIMIRPLLGFQAHNFAGLLQQDQQNLSIGHPLLLCRQMEYIVFSYSKWDVKVSPIIYVVSN